MNDRNMKLVFSNLRKLNEDNDKNVEIEKKGSQLGSETEEKIRAKIEMQVNKFRQD